MTWHLTII